MAFSTLSTALFSVSLSPTPISATPPLPITALMSAKSRLTRPALVTSSATPFTLLVSISSATLNAVCNGKSGASSSNLSLGITMSVSTTFSNFSSPIIAFSNILCPSIAKGKVTTATVNEPSFLAISATTGALPVPVPPPSPHVMNIMSAPLSTCLSSCSDSLAASSPILGMLPAPSPRVISFPIKTFLSAVV